MKLSELFSNLSYGPLSNLSMSGEGSGDIHEADQPKVVKFTNDGLLRLYSKFVLLEKDLLIEMVEGITTYNIDKKHSDAIQPYDRNSPYPYIIERTRPDKFDNDLIRITEVYDSLKRRMPLNDSGHPRSCFTPQPTVLQVPKSLNGIALSIIYQAEHPTIIGDDLDQEIILPSVLVPALEAFISGKVFSSMNGADNTVKGKEHLDTFEGICQEVAATDVVSNSTSSTTHLFEIRGWK